MVVSARNAQSANAPRGSVCVRKNAEIVGTVEASEFVRTTRENASAGSAKERDSVSMESIKVTAHNATDLVSAITRKISRGMRCARMKNAKDADCGCI